MLTTIVITALMTLGVFVAGILSYRWWLRHRTPTEIRRGVKRCDVCLVVLPAGTCRTAALGHWRCPACKGKAA